MRTVGYVRPSNKSVGESNAYRLRTSCDGERNYSSEVADVTLPRKASKEHVNCPYRKPTQVVEESILR